MKKPTLLITFSILTILVLAVVRISVANKLSTSGIMLSKIENQLGYYKKENLLLQESLLTYSSFTHIASQAAQLGFVQDKKSYVLNSTLPLAIKQ